ncbi:MAG: hypothetical protein ACYDAC_08825 [Candidatus Dormibacteria bacterium]
MARLYAQLCAAIFLLIGIGGLFAGSAGPAASNGGGNVGSLVLHLTWVRDALDIGLLAVFAWIGFVASRHAGRLATGIVGALLLAVAVAGFIHGDDLNATKSFLGMYWSTPLNVLDLVVGTLAVLAALGTVEDQAPQRSVLRS